MRTLYSDNDIEYSIEEYKEFSGGFLHLKLNSFSLSIYKKMHTILDFLCKDLKKKGHDYVFCLVPKDKEKLAQYFGFSHTDILIETYRIMKREL
jgi:hypothetical protein